MTIPARRVLLVEDQAAVRTLASATLEREGFDVLAVESSAKAISHFAGFDPDVLIADIDLGERPNGVELATILRAQAPYVAIVFLTNYPAALAFERTITPPAGFAFVQKEQLNSVEQFVEAIESALNDAAVPQRDVDAVEDAIARLTPSQMELLRMMAAGLTNQQIAEQRGGTVRAVERHISRTFDALGLDDRNGNPRVIATNMYTQRFGYVSVGEFTS